MTVISTQPGPFTFGGGSFNLVAAKVAVTGGHRIKVSFTSSNGAPNEQWLKEVNSGGSETGPGTKGPDGVGGSTAYNFQHTLTGGAAFIQLRSGVNSYTITNIVYDDLDAAAAAPPRSIAIIV